MCARVYISVHVFMLEYETYMKHLVAVSSRIRWFLQ